MKKVIALFTIMALVFSVSFADLSEAKPRGGFKSGTQKFKQPTESNVQKTTPTKNTNGTAAATAPNKKGFFGGGLMTGLFAGFLLGGLLGGLGMFGDLLGLILNIVIIYVIFIAIRGLFRYFSKSKRPSDERRY